MWNIPKEVEDNKIDSSYKARKEKSCEVSKYRPISLINVGVRILEKVFIKRISHHIYTKGYMNNNQYGFIPQDSTIDAAKAVKGVIEEGFNVGEVTVIVCLDEVGAFNGAWWPRILKSLKACECPQNLYNLTKSYFKQRTSVLQTNNIKPEKVVTKGCPQGSYSGPGTKMYSTTRSLTSISRIGQKLKRLPTI